MMVQSILQTLEEARLIHTLGQHLMDQDLRQQEKTKQGLQLEHMM